MANYHHVQGCQPTFYEKGCLACLGEGSKGNESKDVLSFNVQALTKVMVNLLKKEEEKADQITARSNKRTLQIL